MAVFLPSDDPNTLQTAYKILFYALIIISYQLGLIEIVLRNRRFGQNTGFGGI